MRFIYESIASLPRLAWCARLRKHEEAIHVYHGPWVETGPDGFIEGAWDGPFEAFAFDEAITFVGSGGRLTEEGVLFSAPTHNIEWIYTLHQDDELFVSNSFTFLLVMAGAEPDLQYADYFFDLLDHARAGLVRYDKALRLAGRRRAVLHAYCNVVVHPDLSLHHQDKPTGTPPANYATYAALLETILQRLFQNAQHPGRQQPYRPVTTLSQGYDSTAVAAVASRVGCREAVTFNKSLCNGAYVDDSGTDIAAPLGLEITGYERLDYRSCGPLPDAEFYFNPYSMSDKSLLVMQDQLAGSVLLFGRFGEAFWAKNTLDPMSLLQEPNAYVGSGMAITEFRLRTGFLYFPVPYIGALHSQALHGITVSKEMQPWSIGGSYDRPIARRLAEEAGVPRYLFGQRKRATFREGKKLSPPSEEDFLRFYQEHVRPSAEDGRIAERTRNTSLSRLASRLSPLVLWLRRWGPVRRLINRLIGYRLHPMWKSRYLYIFHWGFARTKDRYQGLPFS